MTLEDLFICDATDCRNHNAESSKDRLQLLMSLHKTLVILSQVMLSIKVYVNLFKNYAFTWQTLQTQAVRYVNAHPELLDILKTLEFSCLRAWSGSIADWDIAGVADDDMWKLGDRGSREARKKRDVHFPFTDNCTEKMMVKGLISEGARENTVPRSVKIEIGSGDGLSTIDFE